MTDKVYFFHSWSYERQSDAPCDNYEIYLTKEEADQALNEAVEKWKDDDGFAKFEDSFEVKSGNWTYRYWVDSEFVKHRTNSPAMEVKLKDAKHENGDPVFNGIEVKLDGEWEKLGIFVDDKETMEVDMEWTLNKLIRKYISFNKLLGGSHKTNDTTTRTDGEHTITT